MKPQVAPLVGERVLLRLLIEDDLTLTRAWRNRGDVRVRFTHSEPLTEEGHRAWFKAYAERDDDFVFLIVDRETDAPIGQVSLYRVDYKAATAEYGRLVMGEEAFRRRGLAREATRVLLDWGFDTLGLRVVRLEVLKDNGPARRLYDQLGFVAYDEDERHVRMRVHAPACVPTSAAPRSSSSRDRPTVLAVLPAFIPSMWLCIIRPFSELHGQGAISFRVTTERHARPQDFDGVDVAVFGRNTEPGALEPLREAKRRGARVIYEIDDNFFDIDPTTPIGRYHRDPARLATHATFLRAADLVRTYTRPVFEHASACNASVKRVRPPAYLPPSRPRSANSRPKIVYATSRHTGDPLAAIFLPALKQALAEVGDGVEVTLWGTAPGLLARASNVRVRAFDSDYRSFLDAFDSEQFDIGLAPLKDDVFYRSKTNNKFREYAACRVAGIYSAVDVYTDCVEHERTGLIVENSTRAWYEALMRLIRDAVLRERIKVEAERVIREDYSLERYGAEWLQDVHSTLVRSPTEACWIPDLRVSDSSLIRRVLKHVSDLTADELRRVRIGRDLLRERIREQQQLNSVRWELLLRDGRRWLRR